MTDRQQATRGARTLRGLAVATVATLIAALSHVAAGGNAPSVVAVLLSIAIALPFVTLLAGRRSLAGVAVSVAGTQLLFHWLFVWIVPDAAGLASLRWSSHAEHLAQLTQRFSPTLAPVSAAGAQWLMVAAHAVAGVLTLALLRYADAACDAVQRVWLRLRSRRRVTPSLPPARRAGGRLIPVDCAVAAPRGAEWFSCQSLRGPPVAGV